MRTDRHPLYLYLDFILTHKRVPGGTVSIDIETEPHPDFLADGMDASQIKTLPIEFMEAAMKLGFTYATPPETVIVDDREMMGFDLFADLCQRAGLTPPRQFENRDALNPARLRIGSIQVMDSLGQFAFFEGDEAEMLSALWKLMPQNGPWPTLLTYYGETFDLPVLEARSRFLRYKGVHLPERVMATSKWGDRDGICHLDLAKGLECGGRSMMKLDSVARACGLPGKPMHLAKDAVAYLSSGDPAKRQMALEYMIYDVLTPIQIAHITGIFYDRVHRGIGLKTKGAPLLAPFVFPQDVTCQMIPMEEPLPKQHLQLLRIIGTNKDGQNMAMNTPISSIPNLHADVRHTLSVMRDNGSIKHLFDPVFGVKGLAVVEALEKETRSLPFQTGHAISAPIPVETLAPPSPSPTNTTQKMEMTH